MTLSASVVIITYARPDYVRECLEYLSRLTRRPLEIIVVDASPDDRTRTLILQEFPAVRLLRNELGAGTIPESRQIGLSEARGDIVAFIDDDAFVDPDWLDYLLMPYSDPEIVGVGGRAVNNIHGEESEGLESIGRLLPNGQLTGNFSADPGRIIEVDHLLGANMSFRRSALEGIGGIRGNYPGTCLCEESDISLRLKQVGGVLVFQPRAVVRPVAAPYTNGGKQFDRRYLYYARRNHLVLLIRNFGWRTPLVRRYALSTLRSQRAYFREAARRVGPINTRGQRRRLSKRVKAPIVLTRSLVELTGLVVGVPAAAIARARDKRAAVATDGSRSAPGLRITSASRPTA